jgi:hypothetical protein
LTLYSLRNINIGRDWELTRISFETIDGLGYFDIDVEINMQLCNLNY